jgi:fucose 4-O-acetylase-like acetyltransferase
MKDEQMQDKVMTGKDKLDWMLLAKGVGIILVVIGHFYPTGAPPYWRAVHDLIYAFHMPLFFMLSGMLYAHGKYAYADLIQAKVKRLLYPFVSIAGLFFIIKYAAGKAVHLEHPVGWDAIVALLISPVNSFMPLLWFVHALFLIFVIFPGLRRLSGNLPILAGLLLINALAGSDFPVLGRTVANMPFFVVGVMIKESTSWRDWAIGPRLNQVGLALLSFLIIYAASLTAWGTMWRGYPAIFLCGVAGSVLVINGCQRLAQAQPGRWGALLAQLGHCSMSIYLFHILLESAVRIGFLQVLGRFPVPFELIALVAIACGLYVPLMAELHLLRRFQLTRKFILGLS